MSNEFNINKFLKEKFKEDKELGVPKEIHEGLESILNNLPEKKKRNRIKDFGKVAVITVGIFLGTGFAFPAFAEGLPVVGDFFKSLHEMTGYNRFVSSVEKNNESKVESVTDSNIKIDLVAVIPDETGITIAYNLKSLDGRVTMPQVWGANVEVNGIKYDTNIDNIIHEEKEDEHYHISRLDLKDVPEKFDYKINLTNITGVDGVWSFNGSLDKSKIDSNTVVKNLNIEKETVAGKIKIISVVKTPLYIKVEYVDENDKLLNNIGIDEEDYDNRYSIGYNIIPSETNGRYSMSSYTTEWSNHEVRNQIFVGLPDDLNYLDIISTKSYIGDANIKEITPENEVGNVIYSGEKGKLTLIDFKREEGKELLKVKVETEKDSTVVGLIDRIVKGKKVNKNGAILNSVLPTIINGNYNVKNGEEIWLQYESDFEGKADKFFVERDRENSYYKYDEENKIRIEF